MRTIGYGGDAAKALRWSILVDSSLDLWPMRPAFERMRSFVFPACLDIRVPRSFGMQVNEGEFTCATDLMVWKGTFEERDIRTAQKT